jgi:CBS domain-containing protein
MKRNVFSVTTTTTLGEAARLLVEKHIGLLPVIDDESKLVGILGLADVLTLFLPDFVNLIDNLDFVHDFGALEDVRASPALQARPVSEFMREPVSVEETVGLLRAYTRLLKYELHDLPVVKSDMTLVGIASRVDVGTAFLATWGTKPLTPPEKS